MVLEEEKSKIKVLTSGDGLHAVFVHVEGKRSKRKRKRNGEYLHKALL